VREYTFTHFRGDRTTLADTRSVSAPTPPSAANTEEAAR
jgi:hypothetical protein